MADHPALRARYGEAFWRAHHEAWKRSDLNQREYCELHGLKEVNLVTVEVYCLTCPPRLVTQHESPGC